MAVVAVPVVRRADSKLYPEGGALPAAERARAITIAHRLHCRDHLSFRATQKALESYGIRRSLGRVHHDITYYACRVCDPEAFADASAAQTV
jgi:hypothetical protein